MYSLKKFSKFFIVTFIILNSAPKIETFIRNFEGFQVIRAQATNTNQFEILRKLYEDDTRMDFWTKPSILRGTDIMISLDHVEDLKEYFVSKSIPYSVMIEDVQKIITKQRMENDAIESRAENSDGINWDSYNSLADISKWLDKLAEEYPEVCKTEVIGRSSEGRTMKLIKISFQGSHTKKKLAIWIDGGIHSREWISIAAVTYFINELVTNASEYLDFLSKVEFYILPVVNPDGYEYTWSSDRMWRKTRSDYSTFLSRGCRGVDANRNFGYMYGGTGTSIDKCSEIYRGPSSFSEPETRAVRDYILKSSANFKAFLTIHSYSQVWVYPWGYASELPPDWKDLHSLAKSGADAIEKRFGTKYTCGSSTNVLYAAAGGSDDWAKGVGNITYSYTLELRDTGNYGFLLPPSQILPTCQETWDGIQVVGRYIANLQ